MRTGNVDNRKYKRIFFTPKDDIQACIIKDGQHDAPITVTVMNLSEGGLGLSIKTALGHDFIEGEHLVIQEVMGHDRLAFIVALTMEIKWTFRNPALEHIGFGCEFLQLSDTGRKQLKTFVESWHHERQ